MAKRYDVVCLDSCVILDCFQKDDAYYPSVEPMLKAAESGDLEIIVSVLCISEVFKIEPMEQSDAMALIDAFFDQEYVHIYDVNDLIAKKSVEIRRGASLETADAIHLATAIIRGADAFITRDGEGKKAKKRGKKTIIELREKLSARIDILSPKEFFESLSSETKQIEIPKDEDEQDQKEVTE